MNHEYFREICAAASIGQATAEELFELEQHLAECRTCQQAYFDYLNLAAEEFTTANGCPDLPLQTAKASLNSELFTRRFFERAEREGIQFSVDVAREVRQLMPITESRERPAVWSSTARRIAATVLVGLGLWGSYFYGGRSERRVLEANSIEPRPIVASENLEDRIVQSSEMNRGFESQIDRLSTELRKATEQVRAAEVDLHSTLEDRRRLNSEKLALETQLGALKEALAQSQTLVLNAQREAAENGERTSALEATVVADNIKISSLSDQLAEQSASVEKERQLLALGHDVSDLMGARNLHIVDVVDTDPRGKTRPAFGRIFFTEGKSLVFYAYDLNEAKIQKANYQYRIWAKQEGADKQIRSLGIFYSDDKAQRRWVFKCDDPRILSVIDSVFVTLEPTNSDHPRGPNLMYAYLWGQPNHP
jgi:uncharacterized coiled-coil protein SlyX